MIFLLILNVLGGDSKSDCNTEVEMETKYPHEDAEKLAYEKSEDVYKTWELFWKSHSMNIKDNVLQNTQGKIYYLCCKFVIF